MATVIKPGKTVQTKRQLGLDIVVAAECLLVERDGEVVVGADNIIAPAELLGVISDTLTGKSEAIARSPIKFYLLSNTFIKGQEALVL
jgi:hypothetical protein